MANIIEFPSCIFTPDDILFVANFRNTIGAPSFSGATQVVGNASGCWEAVVSASKIRNSKLVQLWEVLELRTEGRLNPIILPVCGRRKPKLTAPPLVLDGGISHSDLSLFDDSTGYAQDVMPVVCVGGMAVGARAGVLQALVDIGGIEAGFFFTMQDSLYRVQTAKNLGGGKWAIEFWPRLRAAAKSGANMNFSRPTCKMRLKSDTAMSVVKKSHKFATHDLEFTEYF